MTGRPHRAKKSLGQNFLVDPNLQRRIVAALGAEADDTVLEIGPGQGALTKHLAGTVARLVLVELDDALAADLTDRYTGRSDVEVIHADVLTVTPGDLVADPSRLKVVGNIPYNITTPIVFHLLTRPRPARIVLMVQREVADRMVAQPGSKAYGALSVGITSVADARILFGVPRGAFRPVPRVESAVVEIVPHHPPRLSDDDEVRLRRLVRALFSWRRKQLGTSLREHPDLALGREAVEEVGRELALDLVRRPETLDVATLLELARRIPYIPS